MFITAPTKVSNFKTFETQINGTTFWGGGGGERTSVSRVGEERNATLYIFISSTP